MLPRPGGTSIGCERLRGTEAVGVRRLDQGDALRRICDLHVLQLGRIEGLRTRRFRLSQRCRDEVGEMIGQADELAAASFFEPPDLLPFAGFLVEEEREHVALAEASRNFARIVG